VSYAVTGPATVSGSTLTITGAGSVTVTASQAGNSNNPAATPISQSFTVAKAALTVTANNASIVYGQPLPSFTYAITGFVGTDTSSVVSGTATETTTATSTSAVGTYPISFSTESLTAANYTFTYATGTLTISSSTQAPPAIPTIYPSAGIYSAPQTVVITDSTPGATIYYTTDGSNPSSTSSVYAGPILLNASETINAIAILNGASSGASSAAYTVPLSPQSFLYKFGAFTAASLSTNGGAAVTGNLLQLTDGGLSEARSAWYSTPVPINVFTTDFTFQQLNALADGFTFTIQSDGLNVVGLSGGSLGYAGIGKSVAVKFDLYNNAGEGSDSTGIYENGAAPSIPAINLSSHGINLHSGDAMHAHFVYNGTTLTLTLTDTVTNAYVTESFPVNIPAIVGSNNAYIGFTAGTGSLSATQNILSWAYSSSNAVTTIATPTILPLGGAANFPITTTIFDATPGAEIYYTTDGSVPTSSSLLYGGSITVSGAETINAIAILNGASSEVSSATYTVPLSSQSFLYKFGAFTSAGLSTNGGAAVTGNLLQLTDGGLSEARSAWYSAPVPINAFTTDFTFQQLNASADGFTFTIQGDGLNVVGPSGGSLGYAGIGKSVAVKFDLYNNAGEGPDSTGIYEDGAAPSLPAIDLSSHGINLHSGDAMHAHFVYNGTTLTLTLTDTVTNAYVTESFPVNIPAIVGSNNAYIGFTAGTGGLSATQNILSWAYSQ
jgi:hypothetical protein